MIRLNTHEAKTHLSRYLARIEAGETILLCRRNEPIAEIRPIRRQSAAKRVFGTDKGKIRLTAEFFEPLPADLLAAFNGNLTDSLDLLQP